MRQVQLPDEVYLEAQKRAREAGFASVDEYVADVLSIDICDQTENLDHLFTQERLAKIDAARAEIARGECYTAEEVRDHINKRLG
jgi:hypothetical protein